MVIVSVIGWHCPTSWGCFQALGIDWPTHPHSPVDGGFTGNRLYPEVDEAGRYFVEGLCFRGQDLDRCSMEIWVESDPILQGVVLYDVIGIDFYGVVGGEAVN
jgi:hypothetical protein